MTPIRHMGGQKFLWAKNVENWEISGKLTLTLKISRKKIEDKFKVLDKVDESVFIFDDYSKYDMQSILNIIVNQYGFGLLKQGKNKISLKRN